MMATHARELELDTLTVEQEDRVLTVRFCDPPHNYMTARMQKDLDTLTAAVDSDVSVGAVVLTGGVPKRYIKSGVEAINGGLGVAVTKSWGMVDNRTITAVTPVDDNTSNVRFSVYIGRTPRSDAAKAH